MRVIDHLPNALLYAKSEACLLRTTVYVVELDEGWAVCYPGYKGEPGAVDCKIYEISQKGTVKERSATELFPS